MELNLAQLIETIVDGRRETGQVDDRGDSIASTVAPPAGGTGPDGDDLSCLRNHDPNVLYAVTEIPSRLLKQDSLVFVAARDLDHQNRGHSSESARVRREIPSEPHRCIGASCFAGECHSGFISTNDVLRVLANPSVKQCDDADTDILLIVSARRHVEESPFDEFEPPVDPGPRLDATGLEPGGGRQLDRKPQQRGPGNRKYLLVRVGDPVSAQLHQCRP